MKFTVEIEMKDRWVPHFLSMLKYMENLGVLGGSRYVAFYADGDGDFRPKFNFDKELLPEVIQGMEDPDDYIIFKGGHRIFDAG